MDSIKRRMISPTTYYYLQLLAAVLVYLAVSLLVSSQVNTTSRIIVDELFHIPQGLAYCQRNFTYWDLKITTLPGLYLVSALFLGSYFPCNEVNLRHINLAGSCINLLLFASILKFIYGSQSESQSKILLQAMNLAILPPLYFFSHVYYTDTLSLLFMLAFCRLCFVNKYKILILVIGFCGILMRQTNIVWVALIFGHKFLDIFIKTSRVFGNSHLSSTNLSSKSVIAKDVDVSKLRRYYGLPDVVVALKYHLKTCFVTFFKYLTLNDSLILIMHSILLLGFMVFVYINGSIVVGDKKAHVASLHIPQIFYFLVFYGIFGLPYVVAKLPSTLKLLWGNKINVLLLAILFTVIVKYNTVVHPYLLADNRHYTFYVWNRWYGKYDHAIYSSIPVYIFLLFSLYDNLRHQNCISFLLPYSVALFLVLCLQQMIEVRYFLMPYIILRLRFGQPSFKIVISEFLLYLSLNVVTYYLFFTKEIMWKDFDYPQRIIW